MNKILVPLLVTIVAISIIYGVRYKEVITSYMPKSSPVATTPTPEKACETNLRIGQEFMVDDAAMWLFRRAARHRGIRIPSDANDTYSYGRVTKVDCGTGSAKVYLNLYSDEFELYPKVWWIEGTTLKIEEGINQRTALALAGSNDLEDKIDAQQATNDELTKALKEKEEATKTLEKSIDKLKKQNIR